MNEIVSKFLKSGEKFMPGMHLRQLGFTYRTCGPFTNNKERIKKVKETGDSRYIYQNELYKTCFLHKMAYADFKDLPRRTEANKELREKTFNTAKNPKYYGYQHGLASMVYKYFDKKTSSISVKSEVMPNQQLAEELHKPVIRKFERRKVHSSFIDNDWGADLSDMQLVCKFEKGFRFLLCVINSYSKYACVVPLKD